MRDICFLLIYLKPSIQSRIACRSPPCTSHHRRRHVQSNDLSPRRRAHSKKTRRPAPPPRAPDDVRFTRQNNLLYFALKHLDAAPYQVTLPTTDSFCILKKTHRAAEASTARRPPPSNPSTLSSFASRARVLRACVGVRLRLCLCLLPRLLWPCTSAALRLRLCGSASAALALCLCGSGPLVPLALFFCPGAPRRWLRLRRCATSSRS